MLHGSEGLAIAYGMMLAAVLGGMLGRKAPWERRILAPVLAAVLILVCILLQLVLHALSGFLLGVLNITGILVVGYWGGVRLAQQDGELVRRGTTLHKGLDSVSVSAPWVEAAQTLARKLAQELAQKRDWNLGSGLDSQREGNTEGGAGPVPTAEPSGLTLAGVALCSQDLTKHFKLIGTTGTGKSTAIRELLDGALARGDRAIIADPDGGYLERYYDPLRGDVILNPFVDDSHRWDPYGEIFHDRDVEHLARALLPDRQSSDPAWYEYGRSFFSWAVRQTLLDANRNPQELLRLLTAAPVGELRAMLAGTQGAHFLAEGNERMFGSVRSVTAVGVSALQHIARQEGPGFSVRQWVRGGKPGSSACEGGVLFLPYKADEIATLATMISAWLRLAIFEAMSQPEGDQRLWMVIDELDALGPIDGLKDALARLRKFGVRCVLGFQSISQVWGTYGRAHADTIVENTGTTLILRCSASDGGGTARYASTLIGDQQVSRQVASQIRPGLLRQGRSRSEHISIEPAVMASEIEQLPDLQGYLKVATRPEWSSVQLTAQPSVRRPRPHGPAASPVGEVPDSQMGNQTASRTGTGGAKRRRRAPAPPPAASSSPAPTPAQKGPSAPETLPGQEA